MLNPRTVLARVIGFVAFAIAGNAVAQVSLPSQQGVSSLASDSSMGVSYLPSQASLGGDTGLKLGESSMLHAGLGAEAGYDSNVFFNNTGALSSPVLRVIPFLELTNAGRGGSIPDGVFYDLSANLTYREYLSSDTNIKAQRAFNPTVTGSVLFGAAQKLNFSLTDTFVRFEDAPFGPSTRNITRNHNFAFAELHFAPGGGRFETMLRYSNALLIFDNQELKYANNMGHDGTLDFQWRWLPRTSLFVQGSVGYFDYLETAMAANPRSNSLHYRAIGGLRGLLTQKVSVYLAAGYVGASYSGASTASPSGLANLAAIAEMTYAASLRSRILVGYRKEIRNSSVIGNFMDVNAAYLSLNQNVAGRLNVSVFGRFETRAYTPTPRKDNFIQAGAQADMFLTPWLYAGVTYSATVNGSNQQGANPGVAGLDYSKHLILARLGLIY